jgi:hypothetical protein
VRPSVGRWLERRAEGRHERELARWDRGRVVAGAYVGNRTPGRRIDVMDAAAPVPSRRDPSEPPEDYDG